jgi:peptidase E
MKLLFLAHEVLDSDSDRVLLELTGGRTGLKLAIITTAGDPIEWVPEKEGSEKYVAKIVEVNPVEQAKRDEWGKNHKAKFTEKGYEVVYVDLKKNPKEVREALEHADIIEVGGGDVNYLLDWAKIAGLDKYLKNILDRGVIYVGTSAGAMLPQPDIGFTWWEPKKKWEGTDHVGLGIVDFITTGGPKNGEDEEYAIKRLIARKEYLHSIIKFPWKTYLLRDGQMIKVDGDSVEHIGPGIKKTI